MAEYPDKIKEILVWIRQASDEFDEIVTFLPWDLHRYDAVKRRLLMTRFLLVAAWRFTDGSLRKWLRKVFPSIPEYPAIKNLSTVQKPTLTIADMESFLMMLMIQRHQFIVNELGSETFGQVLFMSTFATWRPTKNHMAFWQSAIYHYGSKVVLLNSLMSN
jgi:hypothetical protein